MAATGKTPILLYGSTTATNVPVAGNLTNSSDGCEIAINVADKNLFFKDSTNAVNTVPIRQSSASSDGWLSSTDWNTFNNKSPAAGSTNITTLGTITTGVWNGTAIANSYLANSSITFGSTAQALGSTVSSINNVTIGNTTSADGTFNNLTGKFSVVFGTSTTANAVQAYTTANWNYSHLNLIRNASNTATPRLLSFMLDADSVSSTTIGGYPAIWGIYSSSPTTGSTSSALNAKMGLASYAGFNYYINGTQTTTMHASGGISLGDTTDPGAGNLRLGTGNLVIGTSGKGIDFSATAGTGTSELLADYEEGTWTPTITSASGTCTTSSANGRYTKIGRMVYFNCVISFSTDASVGTSNLTIGGLPYAAAEPSIANLILSSWSAGDLGTGGANGLAAINGGSTTTILYSNRTVNISSRTTFSWWYAGYYQAT